MNKKIRVYCLILAIIYVFVVMYTAFMEISSFKAGFKEGITDVPREILHVNMIPKSGGYSFPDKLTDITGKQDIRMEVRSAKVMVLNPAKLPTAIFLGYYVVLFSAFVLLGCTVWLPFLFFKIIRAASKGNFLDIKVISRIRKIGIILIFFYFMDVMAYMIYTLKAQYLMDLENYKFFVDFSGFGTLILGVVTLLLAEILSVTLKMKEEQDLTI